jgi:hypothetical protein
MFASAEKLVIGLKRIISDHVGGQNSGTHQPRKNRDYRGYPCVAAAQQKNTEYDGLNFTG